MSASGLSGVDYVFIPRPFLVSVDGTAVSGKATLAKKIADHLKLVHLDSGALYRATTLLLFEGGGALTDVPKAVEAARSIAEDMLSLPELRTEAVSRAVPTVARIPEVRAVVTERQKTLANGSKNGVVMDGRATGVEVIPHANAKFFVDADLAVRARRRLADLEKRGEKATLEEVLESITRRDHEDQTREHWPLRKMPDMFGIDTTRLDPDQALRVALDRIMEIVVST